MKIVFISNYFNHHQRPLSDALAKRVEYLFLATEPITEERIAMGWGAEAEPGYVCHYDREQDRAERFLAQADVVIAGSAPEALVRECIRRGQPVFRYSERPLKNGSEWHKYLPRVVKWHLRNPVGKPVYLLCASAFAGGDYARFGLFRNKMFRWGYFPEVKRYERIEDIQAEKSPRSILWVGRFLPLKHPDDVIWVAAKLKKSHVPFQMHLIGSGPMEQTLRDMIAREGLEEQVHLLGTMKPEKVRRHMERTQIFLFTSDRREGWGAVLNESMNSGCAAVASDAVGATPYLIRDGENGCVYHSGNVEELYEKVAALLADPGRACIMGTEAYRTMAEHWNAETAAERFVNIAERVVAGERELPRYSEGPGSPAPIIREDWYRK